MLTVLTWLWAQPNGRAIYSAEHVNIWAAMMRRHLTLPHRLACVTNTPDGIDPSVQIIVPPGLFEAVTLPTWGEEKPQCLRRVALFDPAAGETFGGRFVSMDLDCIVSGNLDSLFDRPEEIVLYASPPSPVHQPRPYNGSMLMMTAGARPQVFERFTPEAARQAGQLYAGSDQAWISHVLGDGEATWSEADGVVWWGRTQEGAQGRLTFFPGSPKPWQLVGRHEWARSHYHQNRGGRCLVLGYAPTVWRDLEHQIDRAPFDAVIASPEAARHWPGEIAAIARDDHHADQLAALHGFSEVVVCGRT